MKKIFIPALTLIIIGISVQNTNADCWGASCLGRRSIIGEYYDNFTEKYFNHPDQDSYWKNRFRSYNEYPAYIYADNEPDDTYVTSDVKTISVHNYQRNVPVSANKGQRMYDLTTYNVTTLTTGGERYRVNTTGQISGRQFSHTFQEEEIYKPLGDVKINGESYMMMKLPNTTYVALIDRHGNFYDKLGIVNKNKVYVSKEAIAIYPHDLKFVPSTRTTSNKSNVRLQYEIKYGGIENNDIVLLVNDNRSGTVSKRIIPATQKITRINDVTIGIFHATPEYIEYKIY